MQQQAPVQAQGAFGHTRSAWQRVSRAERPSTRFLARSRDHSESPASDGVVCSLVRYLSWWEDDGFGDSIEAGSANGMS